MRLSKLSKKAPEAPVNTNIIFVGTRAAFGRFVKEYGPANGMTHELHSCTYDTVFYNRRERSKNSQIAALVAEAEWGAFTPVPVIDPKTCMWCAQEFQTDAELEAHEDECSL